MHAQVLGGLSAIAEPLVVTTPLYVGGEALQLIALV